MSARAPGLGRVGIWAGDFDLLPAADVSSPDTLDDRLVDAIVAHGDTEDISDRVQGHLDAGADHVSLHLLAAEPHVPPIRQWEQLAAHLTI